MIRLATSFFIAAALVLPVFAQEAPKPNQPPAPLVQALEALAAQEAAFCGSVRVHEDTGPNGSTVQVITAGTSNAKPYIGPIDLLRTAKGELLLVSRPRLPGFVIYDDGIRTIHQVLHEGTQPGLSELAGDLLSLVDVRRLLHFVGRSEWETIEEQATGHTRYEGELPVRIISSREPGGVLGGMMRAKVLATTAVFRLDGDGHIVKVRFRVTRSDPTAALRERALSGQLESGEVMGGLPSGEDVAGKEYEYVLKPSQQNARQRSALVAMRKLASDA